MILSFPSTGIAPEAEAEFELTASRDLDLRAISFTNASFFQVYKFSVGKKDYVVQPADAPSFERLFSQMAVIALTGEIIKIRIRSCTWSAFMFGASILCAERLF